MLYEWYRIIYILNGRLNATIALQPQNRINGVSIIYDASKKSMIIINQTASVSYLQRILVLLSPILVLNFYPFTIESFIELSNPYGRPRT